MASLIYFNIQVFTLSNERLRTTLKRQSGSDVVRSERRMTMFLTAIVFLFILCQPPRIILSIVEATERLIHPEDKFDEAEDWFHIMRGISNLTIAANSSVNMWIYLNMVCYQRTPQVEIRLDAAARRSKFKNSGKVKNFYQLSTGSMSVPSSGSSYALSATISNSKQNSVDKGSLILSSQMNSQDNAPYVRTLSKDYCVEFEKQEDQIIDQGCYGLINVEMNEVDLRLQPTCNQNLDSSSYWSQSPTSHHLVSDIQFHDEPLGLQKSDLKQNSDILQNSDLKQNSDILQNTDILQNSDIL
ncbi:uncharacterized protein LOC111706138 [Eurytemora carolleeae]|uniref:uncharacterized protein LOC111706138 n=1 Tax=Eurytemora carolleeae TaxID=1294199 RepID=UPI000C78C534|nr:uncharacterized protein LOC111706138 [Eurytemora carolleeae]|eukprot:XP_023334691.1 uncharacterized protein LOC111706138 [Eurytemora affinis]